MRYKIAPFINTDQMIEEYGRGHIVRGLAAKLRINSRAKLSLEVSILQAKNVVDECMSGNDRFISHEAQIAITTRHHYYTR
jgi:hypothetical protein